MAVTLDLTYVERNDNKLLTLTDVSEDWGTPAVSAITTLTLDIVVTTSDNTTTTYDQIDLVALNNLGGASTQDDLVFELTAEEFTVSSVALGTDDDVLPDGIYSFTYTLDEGLATESTLEESLLLEGNVRNDVYEALRSIPTDYMCNDCKTKDIMDAIFAYGYLNSIRAAGYVAKSEELINQLYTLERLLLYGRMYSW